MHIVLSDEDDDTLVTDSAGSSVAHDRSKLLISVLYN